MSRAGWACSRLATTIFPLRHTSSLGSIAGPVFAETISRTCSKGCCGGPSAYLAAAVVTYQILKPLGPSGFVGSGLSQLIANHHWTITPRKKADQQGGIARNDARKR